MINKFLGYATININGEIIPVKFGTWALEKFCEKYGIGFSELGDVFEQVEGPNNKKVEVPKNVIKFLTTALWAGASYVTMLEGGKAYSLEDTYAWVDEIGTSTPQAIEIMTAFYVSILNGGPIPKQMTVPVVENKTKSKKKLPGKV